MRSLRNALCRAFVVISSRLNKAPTFKRRAQCVAREIDLALRRVAAKIARERTRKGGNDLIKINAARRQQFHDTSARLRSGTRDCSNVLRKETSRASETWGKRTPRGGDNSLCAVRGLRGDSHLYPVRQIKAGTRQDRGHGGQSSPQHAQHCHLIGLSA